LNRKETSDQVPSLVARSFANRKLREIQRSDQARVVQKIVAKRHQRDWPYTDHEEVESCANWGTAKSYDVLEDEAPLSKLIKFAHTATSFELRDQYRRHKRLEILEEPPENFLPLASGPVDRETVIAIKDVIKQLPERQQRVIIARLMNELSHEEIAQDLGVSSEVVRVTYHRAIKRIRMVLGAVGIEE
jgi:RNA polymerase sigma factor (sigma-70 family)